MPRKRSTPTPPRTFEDVVGAAELVPKSTDVVDVPEVGEARSGVRRICSKASVSWYLRQSSLSVRSMIDTT